MTAAPVPVSGEGAADAYARLAELGLTLPQVAPPLAAYLPAVQSGAHVYVSGQLPLVEGKLLQAGKLGADVSPEQGHQLARQCALNALAAIDALVGLGQITKIVKVAGFVASAPGFTGQPAVVNGASELFVAVLGEIGRHARSAVGVAELPLGAPVEVEVIVEVS
jgi:enamine deaminase RidA (YjgF/YER057c/UK114 family)